jgi:acetaldehyde dehydrogenase/alcohol dehydrogenase
MEPQATSQAQGIMEKALAAAREFRKLDQKATDQIVRAVYLAALDRRLELAKMAREETGMGVWQHKVIKNVIATQIVFDDIRDRKTVGVISQDINKGMIEVAAPLGPILGFMPVTNPTSTTIFKCLITMKTRNPLIISTPQAARHCISAAAQICYEAALKAGAPENCIQWLNKPSENTLKDLMAHHKLALILATGTDAVVRKASMSGTPVIGVGPGNVPVYIGASADIPYAVKSIIASKTLDNGTICASEQAAVVKRETAEEIVAEFKKQGGYFLSPEEIEKVGRIAYDPERGMMSPLVVGQSVERIAQSAGISVPEGTKLLLARLEGVGREYPLSAEILAPILAFYVEEDFDAAIRRCTEITHFGGLGHTAVIYSNTDERIEYFSKTIDASRILVNIPSVYGALGGIDNTLSPSFTLGCGSGGNNITTDNITARHLLNIHRITRRRPNSRWVNFDQKMYFDEAATAEEIEREFNKNY